MRYVNQKNHSNHINGSEQVENSTVTGVCTAQIIVSLVIIPAIGSINIDCPLWKLSVREIESVKETDR